MSNRTVVVECRIQNLKSAKGQKLNGLSCSFNPTIPPSSDGQRVAVTIDGVPRPELSLKVENLHMFQSSSIVKDLAVAVGRRDLRAPEMMATVVDQKRGQKITAQMLPAFDTNNKNNITALRSRGTLLALVQYFETQRLPNGDIVIHVTDLNIALLLNSYAVKKKKVTVNTVHDTAAQTTTTTKKTLGSKEQQDLAEKIRKHLFRECRKRAIMFKYKPFRINRSDRNGKGILAKDVLASVLASKFHIYPCPCETFLDALEVRFSLPGRSTHEFFLDYGQDETIQYVNNVFNMDEDMERLKPEVLADIDPQMFWSSVLHSKSVVKVLRGLPECPDEIVKEWSNIYACYLKSVITFKEYCFSVSESVRILPDSRGKWNLINDDIHYNVAFRNAKLAIVLSLTAWWTTKDEFPCIEISENYIGTEIDQKVESFMKALRSKDKLDVELAIQDITTWKETKTCDYCGAHQKKMFDCQRCLCAGYCNSVCQGKAWPTHKKVCKDLEKAKKNQPPAPKATLSMYQAKNVAKNQSSMNLYLEASGFGYVLILYTPPSFFVAMTGHSPSSSNVVAFTAMKKDKIFEVETSAYRNTSTSDLPNKLLEADETKAFKSDMSNLDPIMRLCLSCGPVPNLDLAQKTVDDALIRAQGSVSNLKMKWVGFTPLEWAAKKGHVQIVQWLLSDPRTASLIEVGSPVGWACYAGRIEVARMLVDNGAFPNATHEGFWNSRHPLLAAAENGMIDSVQFLVEECGIDISSVTWKGNGIKDHVKMSPNWNEMPGHKSVLKYAKLKLKKGKRK